jgi:hypothetical protein
MVKEGDLQSRSIDGKDTEVRSCRSYGRAERIGMADIYLLSAGLRNSDGRRMQSAHQRCHKISEASSGTKAFAWRGTMRGV